MFRRFGGIAHSLSVRNTAAMNPYTAPFELSVKYSSTKPAGEPQKLPSLPVPKLEDTLAKYLKTVKPHLNDEEFSVTSKIVKEFQNGVGKKLQSILEKRAQTQRNWLENWWLSTAYLAYRDPVVVFSSPGLVFPFRDFKTQTDQLKYAAKTILASLDYKDLIDNKKIPVEMMGKNPLDMSQYEKIFGTCRIPGLKEDKLSYNSDSRHITVLHHGHIFRLDLWGEDNKKLSEDQIVEQLKKIIDSSKTASTTPIGLLTSENRDNWGKAYDILVKDKNNRAALLDVEQSLFVLCLDQAAGLRALQADDARRTRAAEQTVHGGGAALNGANRWFDKTVQFIVGADGLTGLTYEHSPAEGQPIAVLTDFIIDYIDQNKSSGGGSASPRAPRALALSAGPDVRAALDAARGNLDKLLSDLDLNCFSYEKYGKDFIKSQKLSPDSYLQMAMQYAFYSLHKTPGAHYESAATRMYAGGRTETIRSCSPESVAFARAMLDAALPPAGKLAAMKTAINAHKDYTVQALQGFGVDRHLLGLKLAALESGMELPPLYSDSGYKKSAHMRISTSQVACRCDGFMCYGPLVADGYSTCYNPRPRSVNIATSAFRAHPATAAANYRAALEAALHHMHDVLLQTTPSKL